MNERLLTSSPTFSTGCWGEHPMAPAQSSGLSSSHEDRNLMNPLQPVIGVETARAPSHRPANPNWLILVVDDDALVREMVARILLRTGHRVDTAEDGAAGWEILQARNHDLLLTDHSMPNLTGVELAQKIWFAHMPLPVILMSGAMPAEELEQHPWLRFAALLPKPFSTATLLASVNEALTAPGVTLHVDSPPFATPTATGRSFMPR